MSVGEFISWLDGLVWGTVMMVLIIVVGILLSVRTKFHPQRRLGLSLRYAVTNEKAQRETYPASELSQQPSLPQ